MMGWIDLIVRPGGCAVHRSEDFFICLSSFFHAVFLWRCQGIRTYGRGIRYVTHEKGADAYAICFGPAALPGELFYTADEYRHRFLPAAAETGGGAGVFGTGGPGRYGRPQQADRAQPAAGGSHC